MVLKQYQRSIVNLDHLFVLKVNIGGRLQTFKRIHTRIDLSAL